MRGAKAFLLGMALLGAAWQAQAVPLITNGNFESDPLGFGWSTNSVPGSVEIGVSPISAYLTCCSPLDLWNYPGGSNAAFFGWGDEAGGSIWQDIETVAGRSYRLSFLYGAISAGNLQSMRAEVLNGTSTLASLTASATGTHSMGSMMSSFSLAFTATSDTTRIRFSDENFYSTLSVDGVLDNVSVTTAVPEPETWALMLAGLGLMGAVARRRRS